MNNHHTQSDVFDELIKRQCRIVKLLQEIKIKIADVKECRRELAKLIKDIEDDIISALIVIDVTSDSE